MAAVPPAPNCKVFLAAGRSEHEGAAEMDAGGGAWETLPEWDTRSPSGPGPVRQRPAPHPTRLWLALYGTPLLLPRALAGAPAQRSWAVRSLPPPPGQAPPPPRPAPPPDTGVLHLATWNPLHPQGRE